MRRDRRRASVLMEFLLVFPIIILLVSMLLQFAQIWIARQITAYAAYCATRATLCVKNCQNIADSNCDCDEHKAARAAAMTACSWMCLAGLSIDQSATLRQVVHTPLNWNKYHDMTDEVASDSTLLEDVSAPRPNTEQEIPGWGTIPGSSSRGVRVRAEVLDAGGYASAVRVRFRFPLIFPLAGRIISWASNNTGGAPSSYNREKGVWKGDSYYSIHTGWHRGKETVMNDDGTLSNRFYATYGQDGKFPVIELTEICVLPCPYKRGKFKGNRYNPYNAGGGGT